MANIETLFLPAEHQLTVVADGISAGSLFVIAAGSAPSSISAISASSTTTFGPFNAARQYALQSDNGKLSHSSAKANVLGNITSSEAELNILDGVNATASELNRMSGITATTAELNIMDGVTASTGEINRVDGLTATTNELNNAADVSSRVEELTATAAATAGVQSVELNHISVVIAATIADSTNHSGLFIVKDTSASGTEAHTLTLTAGTFDGTNTIATLNAPDEALMVYFDSAGNGTIIENVGTVVLS